MSKELMISKDVIFAYLGETLNANNISVMYDIQSGNKEVLYEHIKALYNIFGKAKDDLEKELEDESKKC